MLQPALPEIAFVGRSNVGKSSLLNALVGRRALARVSSTPGKTQHVNVFQLPTFYLIDLPGYGWARASATDRRSFRQLLETYLKRRERLAGIVWLLDIRHSPSLDDQEVHAVLVETGRPTLVALTKGDKLPQERRAKEALIRARELGMGIDGLVVTSTKTGDGIRDLAESVLAAVAAAQATSDASRA